MTEKQCDTFLLMWDMYGLESIINVSAMERQAIDDALYDRTVRGIPLNALLMRARLNTQRRYEIYAVESELSEDSLIQYFTSDPQNAVDTIRRVGRKIYSDADPMRTQVIK